MEDRLNPAVIRSMIISLKEEHKNVGEMSKRLFIQNIAHHDPNTTGILAACAARTIKLNATIAQLESLL